MCSTSLDRNPFTRVEFSPKSGVTHYRELWVAWSKSGRIMEGLHIVGGILSNTSINCVLIYMMCIYTGVYVYGFFLCMLHVYLYYYFHMNLCICIIYLYFLFWYTILKEFLCGVVQQSKVGYVTIWISENESF
jgi:hypothetical protein